MKIHSSLLTHEFMVIVFIFVRLKVEPEWKKVKQGVHQANKRHGKKRRARLMNR